MYYCYYFEDLVDSKHENGLKLLEINKELYSSECLIKKAFGTCSNNF